MHIETDADAYRQAGSILAKALEAGVTLVQEGKLYSEVAERIESIIWEKAAPAFPVNISVNNVAAHYTPTIEDMHQFSYGDVVKLDVGVHVNGYIADSAQTVIVGNSSYADLARATEESLEKAIEIIKTGTKISDIGKTIEGTITTYGFRPVINLQGHSLERFNLHAGLSIPNVSNKSRRRLNAGEVIAIEPFATNGRGTVINGELGCIYRMTGRGQSSVVKAMKQKFGTLPFASRWMHQVVESHRIQATLRFLLRRRYVYCYNILLESGGGIVAQKEHTVMVTKDGCEVITHLDK
jgi:methionyl aminopeptidase